MQSWAYIIGLIYTVIYAYNTQSYRLIIHSHNRLIILYHHNNTQSYRLITIHSHIGVLLHTVIYIYTVIGSVRRVVKLTLHFNAMSVCQVENIVSYFALYLPPLTLSVHIYHIDANGGGHTQLAKGGGGGGSK